MTSPKLLCLVLALVGCSDSGGDGDDGGDAGAGDGGGGPVGTFSYRPLILTMIGEECSDDCPAGVDLQVCGEMTNNTTEEQSVTTPSTCLVEQWRVSGPTGSETLRWDCVDGDYDRYFQPEESQAFCYSPWAGAEGTWSITAEFGTGEEATGEFVLQ